MLTITAVIRAKKGHEDTMRRALLEVAENVRSNEPNTIGFFVSQDQTNPSVFTTYERFLDQAAMEAHNKSQVVARFFGIANFRQGLTASGNKAINSQRSSCDWLPTGDDA